ncbi:MAG: NTP transferase domain-containing protein [Candidatus Krumholzibacteriota bacterium]|nr:NTP transferase domain-containing protein [Candidatus Krumholzibacteriota bacterium]
MKAVVLAGGLGTRIKPFTQIIPKPLLPIGEKAVLEIQIEQLAKYGFNEIYLATNYKSDYIENFFGSGKQYGITLKVSKEEKRLGTAGPLSLLRDELDEPFVVMNGDILTQLDFSRFYEFAITRETILTVGIKEIITPFQFGNIFYDGDFVTGIEEKPDIRTQVLAGIYIMRPEILDLIPHNEPMGMDTLIIKMLSSNMPVAKYEIHEYWLDIGMIDDYEKAQDIYSEHFKE